MGSSEEPRRLADVCLQVVSLQAYFSGYIGRENTLDATFAIPSFKTDRSVQGR
jgi:hypothetical protein